MLIHVHVWPWCSVAPEAPGQRFVAGANVPRLCFPVCFPLVTRNLGTLSASYLPLCFSNCVSQLSASLFSNCVSTGTLEHLGTLSPTVSPSCLSIVSRSYPYCFSIVSQVYFWCFPLVSRLFHTCLPTVSHCLSIVSSLPPCYFSTVSHVYPACLRLSTP